MENQAVRLFILVILVILLTADLKDLFDALSTTSTVGPYLTNWQSNAHPSNRHHSSQKSKSSHTRNKRNTMESLDEEDSTEEDEEMFEPQPPNLKYYPTGPSNAEFSNKKSKFDKKVNQDTLFQSMTEEERKELRNMKSHMAKIMQESCLPKLVCELHASLGERTSLSEAEKGLLTIIKDTSMNPMGEVISRYHFAAHMGQLLAGVEGNGCHNFFPKCFFSRTKVLQLVKKVHIR